MIPLEPYGRDEDLAARVGPDRPRAARAWAVGETVVVVGRSNRPDREVHLEQCRRDGVPVRRRRGGGGAVVLAPGCVVVELAAAVEDRVAVARHMARAVERLARALEEAAGVAVTRRGTGDLCVGERKFAGSSVFSRRGVFCYQASVLVAMDLALVDRYLPHPSREPEYRAGRPHGRFLVNLRQAGYGGSPGELAAQIERALRAPDGEER